MAWGGSDQAQRGGAAIETYRLKNIAITILLLLNAFLLVLLGYQTLQARRTETDAAEQLAALCEANQLALGPQVDLDQAPLSPLTIARRSDTEGDIAAYLLGGAASSSSQGGGIVSYAGKHGAIQFRAGGSFDGSRLTLPVDDITAFCQAFCQQFGYENLQFQIQNQSGSVTAAQQVMDVPIAGCELTLLFEGGVLTGVAGAHVSLDGAAADTEGSMTCVTALVRFLDYRSTAGIVCSEVTRTQCVYELQSGGVPRLLPMWRIETDTYTYFVDCGTGEVVRR